MPEQTLVPRSPGELFHVFTRLALQGFGGVLPVAQRELVDRQRWLSREQFLEMLSIAQVLPGPNIVNLALIVLQRKKEEAKGGFEVPTVVPALGMLTCATLLYHAQPKALLTALVLLVAISALYFTLKPAHVLADAGEPASE